MGEAALPAQDESAGQTLCKACGACCNGMWFPHVNLESQEPGLAERAGMKVVIVDGQARAPQPCPLHRGGSCSAYGSWRPRACEKYQCKLLDEVTAGTRPLDEALQHVRAVLDLAARIRAELPAADAGLLGPPLLERVGADASDATRLDAVALNMYYAKYFRRPADTQGPAAN